MNNKALPLSAVSAPMLSSNIGAALLRLLHHRELLQSISVSSLSRSICRQSLPVDAAAVGSDEAQASAEMAAGVTSNISVDSRGVPVLRGGSSTGWPPLASTCRMLSSTAVQPSPAQQQQQHAAGVMHHPVSVFHPIPGAVRASPGSSMRRGQQPLQQGRPNQAVSKEHLVPTFACVEDAKAELDRLCQSISQRQPLPEDLAEIAEMAQVIRRPPAPPAFQPASLQPSPASLEALARSTAADKPLQAAPAIVSVPHTPTTDALPPPPPPPEVMEMATRELGHGNGLLYSASLEDGYRGYLHSLGRAARAKWRQQAWGQLGNAFRSGQKLPSSLVRAAEAAAAESYPTAQSSDVLGPPYAAQLNDWEGELGAADDASSPLPFGQPRSAHAPSFDEYARAVRAEMEARETALTFERSRICSAGRRGAVEEIPGRELLVRWRGSLTEHLEMVKMVLDGSKAAPPSPHRLGCGTKPGHGQARRRVLCATSAPSS